MASSSVQKKSTSNAEGNGDVIKTVLIIGAIVVVVVFAIVMVVKSNSSSSGIVAPVQVATSQDQANDAILTQLASKCKGNYSLLNAQDKAQADQIAHGRGAVAISVMYHK
jgi:parvulin-like peptidyl-prolyl isomerase